jgi:hypothetical protein
MLPVGRPKQSLSTEATSMAAGELWPAMRADTATYLG